MHTHWRSRTLYAILAIATVNTGVIVGQDLHPRGALIIIREQLRSISEEILDRLQLVPSESGRVAVFAGPARSSSLAENALVEALQKRRHRVTIGMGRDSTDIVLHVFVLEQAVQYGEVSQRNLERTIRTTVEARWMDPRDLDARSMGAFHREFTDTVAQREENVLLGMDQEEKNERSSVFERMITPIIVVAGTIVIVYLFFTVRS